MAALASGRCAGLAGMCVTNAELAVGSQSANARRLISRAHLASGYQASDPDHWVRPSRCGSEQQHALHAQARLVRYDGSISQPVYGRPASMEASPAAPDSANRSPTLPSDGHLVRARVFNRSACFSVGWIARPWHERQKTTDRRSLRVAVADRVKAGADAALMRRRDAAANRASLGVEGDRDRIVDASPAHV